MDATIETRLRECLAETRKLLRKRAHELRVFDDITYHSLRRAYALGDEEISALLDIYVWCLEALNGGAA